MPTFPENIFPEDSSNPYADYTLEQLTTYLKKMQLNRAPGSQFEYSNMGMALVGYILEAQTGKQYEQLVNERIAHPLHMESTSIEIPVDDSSRLAKAHSQGQVVSNWDLPAFEAAGALRSSGSDMLRFLKAQMGLLESDLYPYMTKPRSLCLISMKGSYHRAIKLGWAGFMELTKIPFFGIRAAQAVIESLLAINKKKGNGAVVLSNSTANLTDIYFHLLDDNYPLSVMKQSIGLTTWELQRFTGEYKSELGFFFYVTVEDGKLFILLTGQKKSTGRTDLKKNVC